MNEDRKTLFIGHSLYPVSEKNSCHVFFPFAPKLDIKLQTCSPAVRAQQFIDAVNSCDFSNAMNLMSLLSKLNISQDEYEKEFSHSTETNTAQMKQNLLKFIKKGTSLPSSLYSEVFIFSFHPKNTKRFKNCGPLFIFINLNHDF